ncbi:beta-ketoacyl synthase chain length factor [Gelidibacter salicanalis]|uniref:Beta-ketoacyl synthase chain length factor n=1 Tax=Gelidibacter salicanalis TaxID=291193 RepID=A0A934NBF1_9FLAO|nr:beta-ketoacyl synthase chain length factor [Gelidibacter salicanalis]MBJ7879555.1 beta-ketoacyl synthase chain length factor [Gelidibacter salicanalis]
MKNVYLHSAVSISAQNTFDSDGFLEDMKPISGSTVPAQYPNYKDFIAPMASRRMATGVKMGVSAASKALYNAQLTQPDAIITGTGMGCIEDTEKFLNSIIGNAEEFLTPTAFIQSTHNTVGAQIALGLKCKAYNNTYVHAALSFESALLDAQLLLQQEEAKHVLVGGVDELGTEIISHVRHMEDANTNGIQVPFGEGASFFVVSSEAKAIQLVDMDICSTASENTIQQKLNGFLNNNEVQASDIDVLIAGRNGDVFDPYYDSISTLFKNPTELHYKHLIGEFYTASSFSLWTAFRILNRQHIPKPLIYKGETKSKISTILLYNQFKGRDHSFILLKR